MVSAGRVFNSPEFTQPDPHFILDCDYRLIDSTDCDNPDYDYIESIYTSLYIGLVILHHYIISKALDLRLYLIICRGISVITLR